MCGVFQYFISFYRLLHLFIIFYCRYMPQFIYPVISLRAFEFFHPLSIVNSATIDICLQVSVWPYVFISLEYSPRSGIAGHMVLPCLTLLRNFQTFQNGCILHSDQQFPRSLISLHYCQCFSFLKLLLYLF